MTESLVRIPTKVFLRYKFYFSQLNTLINLLTVLTSCNIMPHRKLFTHNLMALRCPHRIFLSCKALTFLRHLKRSKTLCQRTADVTGVSCSPVAWAETGTFLPPKKIIEGGPCKIIYLRNKETQQKLRVIVSIQFNVSF